MAFDKVGGYVPSDPGSCDYTRQVSLSLWALGYLPARHSAGRVVKPASKLQHLCKSSAWSPIWHALIVQPHHVPWHLSLTRDRLLLQANSEVSALLGRIPSAVGYQPTLATDLGMLQERITTTSKGSITSVQVKKNSLGVYVYCSVSVVC